MVTSMELSGRKQGFLPVEAYTSQAWFDREQDELVRRFGGTHASTVSYMAGADPDVDSHLAVYNKS